jgi:hypothetical protein
MGIGVGKRRAMENKRVIVLPTRMQQRVFNLEHQIPRNLLTIVNNVEKSARLGFEHKMNMLTIPHPLGVCPPHLGHHMRVATLRQKPMRNNTLLLPIRIESRK